jgi:release factor glutamine methyltransferase
MTAARAVPGLKAGITVAEAQRMMAQSFRLAGIDSGPADARALLGAALRLTRTQLAAQPDRILEAREVSAAAALAARRVKREPVSRILGRREFWSLPLVLTPDVLDPRPETETLVEAALDWTATSGLRNERLRLLDIGTGSGALLLALLKELPRATGVALDISPAVLAVARANAERLGLASRCNFVAADMAGALAERFDLVLSNPPYIARGAIASLEPEVREYDPLLALDGGTDGLEAYRAIAAAATALLKAGGRVVVELGIGQEAPVRALVEAAGLAVEAVRPDLGGVPRALVARRGSGEP